MMQSLDEIRHSQTQIHSMSNYNKLYDGFHSWRHMHDRVWYLSVPKSFFDDAITAGPFEYMIAIGFSFEYVLTNLLFVPFMSGAAYNGDMATVTFGFSAQSDEARHMTLGLECIKFMLEQDPDNLPIVQGWLDKWFWRGFRVLGLVSTMMDYMLPKRVMSWREAWEIYGVENGGALFKDLARYGIRPPKGWDDAEKAIDHMSHQFIRKLAAAGTPFKNFGLAKLCQTCQLPVVFTEPDDPTMACHRETTYKGEKYHFCSDGCQHIFDNEPEKYVQAWLPMPALFQELDGDVGAWMDWVSLRDGVDNGDYVGSRDQRNFDQWRGMATSNI